MVDIPANNTLSYHARWNNLRSIGNSPLARASLAVPVLGYLVLFNSDLLNYLKIHSSFCSDCSVSWRLHFFYFGCFFFALGSLGYGVRCPNLIKTYPGATDFFEAEKNYFCNPANLLYLFGLIDASKGGNANDPHNLRRDAENRHALVPAQLVSLAGIMGEHYIYKNFSHASIRILVFSCFSLGSLLLAIPTVATFFQVLKRALQSPFGVF